jgi:holo-[acyl-carrier protein] synthase
MIVGMGIDIVEIGRFERAKPALLRRLFTPRELEYCEKKARKAHSYAGRFAAKEAFLKALGTGYAKAIGWKDVQVESAGAGQLQLSLRGRAAAEAKRRRVKRLHITMSHSGAYAAAVVLLER